jgi:hypothetical protein
MKKILILTTCLAAAELSSHVSAANALETTRIEKLTGAKGSWNEMEGVFKVSVPRTDIAASVAGAAVTPPMGLTAWAAFTKVGDATMVMGDIVLLEDRVNPTMSAALDSGLEVTALHNHFLWDAPRVMFMHIGGMGDEEKLAAAVGRVFAAMKEPPDGKGATSGAGFDPAKSAFNAAPLEEILGVKGEKAAGVFKVSIGKNTRMGGHELGNAMGSNTWAAFVGTDARALVDGDFAMYETELQGVLKALRKGGLQIVAIHNHMTGENPRVVFLHYWGIGPAAELARTIRAALDTQKH